MSNTILVTPNGPLRVQGDIRIEDAEGKLLAQAREASLCRCGHSANKPFCDGTHIQGGFTDNAEIQDHKAEATEGESPLVITVRPNAMLIAKGPMKIISEDGRFETSRNKAAFCRCGHSANKPFCDASHKACGFSSD